MKHAFWPALLAILAFLGILASGCRKQTYPIGQFPEDQLIIGDGGGFSGLERQWILLPGGQLFQGDNRSDSLKTLPSLSAGKTRRLLKEADAAFAAAPEVNLPGNRYYFMRRITAAGAKSMTWSEAAQITPELKAVYDQFRQYINQPENKN
jgi:hypothetical protein